MPKQGDIFIASLMGGYNDTDPPTALGADMCVAAENVEFVSADRGDHSTLGTRRAGTDAITTPIDPAAQLLLLHRHLPTTMTSEAEFWVVEAVLGVTTFRYKDTAWHTVTPVDNFEGGPDVTDFYTMRALTLHGKLFLAYNSAQDRLHVRDAGTTTIRRVGLAEPAAPAVTELGVGAFSGTRYYRVRYTVQDAGVTLRRSEPSETTTYNPADFGSNGLAARVTIPATIGENETHWEVEASVNNADFYRITTLPIATTVYDDVTPFSPGYATLTGAVLSDDVGDYTPLHSAKFLVADDDRVVIAGSWEDEALSSRVAWSPVYNDEGVGNDERSPLDTDNFIDLDTYEGGGITDMARTVNGYIYVFKRDHIYQLTRTGQRSRAYTAHCLTKSRGALTGSVCEGVDQNGRPCVYFMDPIVGPCRIGEGGVQTCGMDIKKSWEDVNLDATVVSRTLFYPDASQVHFWVATGDSIIPDVCLVLHVDKTRPGADGIRKGWTKFTGIRAAALCACLYSENIEDGSDRSAVLRPFIGLATGEIHLCDTGTTDNGTAYVARIKTGPVAMNLLTEFGVMDAAVVAKAAEDVTIQISVDRNFGVESKPYEVDLSPDDAEDPVIKYLDQFNISEANVVQIEFADHPDGATGSWNLFLFAASNRKEGQG